MRPISTRSLKATVIAGAMIGALAGVWSNNSPAPKLAVTADASGYCGRPACESMTWLWTPALRRAR